MNFLPVGTDVDRLLLELYAKTASHTVSDLRRQRQQLLAAAVVIHQRQRMVLGDPHAGAALAAHRAGGKGERPQL